MTTYSAFYRREQQISSVRVASSSNVSGTYSNGANNDGIGATLTVAASSLTIDSVALAVNDRVLLLAQTNGYENGVYFVYSIGSTVVLQRAPDFQSIEQMKPGYYIPVAAGTQLAGSIYGIVEPQVQVIGTNSISFVNSAATPDSVTLANNGLNIYNPAGTFLNHILFSSAITADRNFTIVTGDAARTLTFTGNATLNQDVDSTASPVFAGVTLNNTGLHLLDTNASHDLIIAPGSDLTADRTLTVTTGDADRTLDISAGNVTVSAYGATLVDDATNLVALTTLGLKRGDSDTWGGGGTSFAFTCAGIVATDVVLVSLIASANNVAVTKCVAGAGTITVDFTADPGAGTIVNFLGIPTV